MITAYRYPFSNVVDRILIDKDCYIFLPHSSNSGESMVALWDTGASCTCISQTVAKRMSLVKVNERKLTVADNNSFMADVYCVKMQMGCFVIENLEVCGIPMDGKRENMIIGMDVISKGDLAITNYQGHTFLTFRVPSIELIDYVADIDQYNKCLKVHNIKAAKGVPDKCDCGSGKLFSNCHGQSVYAKFENSLIQDLSSQK